MSPGMRELIPLICLFIAGLTLSVFRLWYSMSQWFSQRGSDEYIGYALDWYLMPPVMFAIGWYSGMFLMIIGITMWSLFNK